MRLRSAFWPAVCLAAILLAGCKSGGEKPATAPPAARGLSPTDPCAERLHEICGGLLSYYVVNHRLPDRLDELRQADPALANVPFACPDSKAPYIYNRAGLVAADQPGRIIIYDAAPSHLGMRWAVTFIDPQDTNPPMTKVIALPEDKFAQAAK